jgi:hypothetical protein
MDLHVQYPIFYRLGSNLGIIWEFLLILYERRAVNDTYLL